MTEKEERTTLKKESLMLNLRINRDLHRLLETAIAERVSGISKSQLVRTILETHFAEKAKKDLESER